MVESRRNLQSERFYAAYNRLSGTVDQGAASLAFAMRLADEACPELVIDLMFDKTVTDLGGRPFKRHANLALYRRIAKTAYENHQENNRRLAVIGHPERKLEPAYQTALEDLRDEKPLSYSEMTNVLESLQVTS
jgi:hypothetical protein